MTHENVFTFKYRLLFGSNNSFQVRVERGGEVTWHGPGQLVGYPILNLGRCGTRKKDLHWFLRQIEQVLINVLAVYDLEGYRDNAGTGVWVDNKKIAAIGLSASKW